MNVLDDDEAISVMSSASNAVAVGFYTGSTTTSSGTQTAYICTAASCDGGGSTSKDFGVALMIAGQRFFVEDASTNKRFTVLSAGNVGVGTVNPRQALEVNGTIRATGYQSSDGSAGITGSTCTAWKNGLCTSS